MPLNSLFLLLITFVFVSCSGDLPRFVESGVEASGEEAGQGAGPVETPEPSATPAPSKDTLTELFSELPAASCGISDMEGGMRSPYLAGDPAENVLEAFFDGEVSHPGASRFGAAFDHGPRQAATLNANFLTLSFPVSSCSEEAKAFINQGVAQGFAYMTVEAERSFRQAFFIDDGCLMALWGVVLSQEMFIDGNKARATKISRLLSELKASGDYRLSDTEARLIDLFYDKLNSGDKDAKHLFNKGLYELALSTASPDLKALSVNFMWRYRSYDFMGLDRDDMDKWVAEILAENPKHPVHHQRVHMWNDGYNEYKLTENASLIGPVLPDAAHMWHMAAHVYNPLARFADADQAFEAAQRVDHAYVQGISEFPYIVHNYAHNADFWGANFIKQGALKAAERLSLDLVTLPLHPLYNDPRNSSSTYLTPFALGVHGFVDDLFRDGLFGPIVKWQKHGILREFIDYPQLSQKEVLKLLAQLVVSLKASQADDQITERYYQRLKEWSVQSKAEETSKKSWIAFVEQYDELKSAPSIEKVEAFAQHSVVSYGFILPLLDQLRADEKIRELVEGKTVEDTLHGALFLAKSFLRTNEKQKALLHFSRAQEVAMKMDQDHPLFGLGSELHERLNGAEPGSDWRGTAKLHDDFVFTELEDKGPLEFPGLYIRGFDLGIPHDKETALVVFVLGGGCLGCNAQLNKLAEEAERFPESKIIIVTTDTDEEIADFFEFYPHFKEAGFHFVSSADESLHKLFRVYDDFEQSPFHGVFLMNRENKVLWADRNALPFTDFAFLEGEMQRLEKAKVWSGIAIPYSEFPKDKRR